MIGKNFHGFSNDWKKSFQWLENFSAPFPGPDGKTGERRLQPWSCQAKTLRFPRRGRAGSPCPPEPVMPKGGAGNVRTHFSTDSGRLASAPPMTSTCTSLFPAARGLAALPTRLCTNETTSSLPGISLGWSGLRDRVVACDEAGRQNKRGRAEARPSPWCAPGRVALPRDHMVCSGEGRASARPCGGETTAQLRENATPTAGAPSLRTAPRARRDSAGARNPSGLGVLSIVSIRSCNQKTTILKIVLAWGWGVW